MQVAASPRRFCVLVTFVSIGLFGAALGGANIDQKAPVEHVLAIGESIALPDALTLTFEAVVEDSRCPTGTDCVWEGDAAVRVRLDERGKAPATYVLHTSGRFQQAFEHAGVQVRLVKVAPHPAANAPIRPQDYRITVTSSRK
jgi:hypothetical protein